jgi:hypothetical protein
MSAETMAPDLTAEVERAGGLSGFDDAALTTLLGQVDAWWAAAAASQDRAIILRRSIRLEQLRREHADWISELEKHLAAAKVQQTWRAEAREDVEREQLNGRLREARKQRDESDKALVAARDEIKDMRQTNADLVEKNNRIWDLLGDTRKERKEAREALQRSAELVERLRVANDKLAGELAAERAGAKAGAAAGASAVPR